MNLEEIRAAMRAKQAEARAKMEELNALPLNAPKERVAPIEAAHNALVDEFDELAVREKSLSERSLYGSAARQPGAERGARNAAITAAILSRHDEARYVLPATALEFRGMSLLEMAAEVLSAEGRYSRGDGRSEVATRALQTTSDFSNILANVASKVLLDAYQAAPPTFRQLGKKTSLKNFRPHSFVRLSDAPQLDEVKEDGEIKRGAMSDSANSISLRTYAKSIGITRQVILNDDVGAFTSIPEMFGRSAANLESDICWGMILQNPTLQDGQPVFSAAHNNLKAAGGSAPSVVSVGEGRTAIAKQRNSQGTVLNIRPKFIVAPSELETPIAQMLYPIQPTQTAAAVPNSISGLVAIAEPRLSLGARGQAGSAVAWYLFADPAAVDTFGYAYLDGQEGPYTETRNGFDVDGIEVKCRHDFGAGFFDYRGVYRNVGS